ncbi:hypothetical protein BDF21DRAFT_418380 [Thamnidium elegans]|nr:hypothetical protein BDF21DRAFT_418380 [Thamnidium elegans]
MIKSVYLSTIIYLLDQLTSRITVARATVTAENCQDSIRHSKTFRDRCLSKELLLC